MVVINRAVRGVRSRQSHRPHHLLVHLMRPQIHARGPACAGSHWMGDPVVGPDGPDHELLL
ncbi:hypothetical protein A6410_04870 [Prescottella equi]|nr:hypothetical protein A6410_04870 [Prescottella equi]